MNDLEGKIYTLRCAKVNYLIAVDRLTDAERELHAAREARDDARQQENRATADLMNHLFSKEHDRIEDAEIALFSKEWENETD